jgi:dTMP kinase
MKSRSLICFTGVDGSGKTTQAKLLKQYLEKNGYSCQYVWGAFRPFLSYIFFASTRALGYWRHTKRNAYTDPLEFAPRVVAKHLGRLWRLFLFVDYQIKTLITIRLPLVMGTMIICDRYFYDVLEELQLSGVSSERFTRLLLRSTPKPLVTFLMDAPETLTKNRRDFSLQYFERRKRFLLKSAILFGFTVIDSSVALSKNQDKIRQETLAKLRKARNLHEIAVRL